VDPGVQLLLALGVLATVLVFTGAFRFALRECAETRELACQPDIPRAAIHGGERRWMIGANRQRALHGVKLLQAGFVAIGITAVFVMTMCMTGIVLLMVFG